jgi:hypothetical protein
LLKRQEWFIWVLNPHLSFLSNLSKTFFEEKYNEALEEVGKKAKLRDKKPRPGGAGSQVVFLQPEL